VQQRPPLGPIIIIIIRDRGIRRDADREPPADVSGEGSIIDDNIAIAIIIAERGHVVVVAVGRYRTGLLFRVVQEEDRW